MAYPQDNFDQQVRDQFGLSPDAQAAVLDFLENRLNGDGIVDTEAFFDPSFGSPFLPQPPIVIPDDVEAAAITGGGEYMTAGNNVLINVETDQDVVINGVTVPGGSLVIISGPGADDLKIVSEGAPATQDGEVPEGSGMILAGGGDDTVTGGMGDDSISGGSGDDSVMAGGGDDSLDGGSGSDSIDGGAGFDMASLGGMASVSVDAGGMVTATSEDASETDMFENVEYLSFDAGEIVLVLGEATDGAVARLYETLLDRAADAGGLQFWLAVAEDDASLVDVAAQFLASDEFAASTGGPLTDEEFVDLLYERGLERAADQAGFEFWVNALDDSDGASISRAQLAATFAESEEAGDVFDYINVTSTDGLI